MGAGYIFILLGSILMCEMTQRRADATLVSTVTFMGVYSLFICLIGVIYGCFTDFALIKQMDGFVVGLSALFSVILTINTIGAVLFVL
jgi:Na+-transporting NADH:ubiquinone oxidoreductase subunit NqrB